MSHNSAHDRYGRIASLVETSTLGTSRVTIIGLGSMGSPVVDQLARHGVGTVVPGRLRLIDGDRVSDRNLIGTIYRLCHVNMPKAEAAASIVREINRDVNVTYWNTMVDETLCESIKKIAQTSDLLGLFADSFSVMAKVSDACHEICPQVMAVFGPRADYAEVAFSVPSATQRLSKTIGSRKRETIEKPVALGCDTAYVAAFVAGLCIRLLAGDGKGSDLMPCYANAPLYLVGLRRAWVFERQPPDLVRSVLCVGAPTKTGR